MYARNKLTGLPIRGTKEQCIAVCELPEDEWQVGDAGWPENTDPEGDSQVNDRNCDFETCYAELENSGKHYPIYLDTEWNECTVDQIELHHGTSCNHCGAHIAEGERCEQCTHLFVEVERRRDSEVTS